METSEIQKRAIRLGKVLVKQLSLEPSGGVFSRWMAYYIAEQMAIAKKAKGEARVKAEQQCFEAILKLWEHRSHLPTGVRPFENYDPIFRALERLASENERPYFYQNRDTLSKVESDEKLDDVQKWLGIARGIDQAARIWLEYVFHQAALSATDNKTIAWLENAVTGSSRDDISIIVHLLEEGIEDIEQNSAQEQEAKAKQLEARIKQLDAFSNFSKVLRTVLATELKSLSKSESTRKKGNKGIED